MPSSILHPPSSARSRRAVIDVGTNSVKLLVAEVDGQIVTPLCEQSEQTRLGRGFYSTNRLQPDAIARTAKAVAAFAELALRWQPVSTRVIATSAARDAINRTELVEAIRQAAGLRVEIISGDQEAEWVFQGVTSDASLGKGPLLILDVGGGSTEFIVGAERVQHFSESFPLGTVRLLESLKPSDPPGATELPRCRSWLADYLNGDVRPKLGPVLRALPVLPAHLVGTGGTTTILARMELKLTTFDRARIESTTFSLAQVRRHVENLWGMPLAERKRIIGLPPNRADVILMGAAIYEAVMEQFDFHTLRVSLRGLRDAALTAAA